MRIVIIDNYDSFTYNLRQMLLECGTDVDVLLNDRFNVADLEKYDKIVFSPGPGLPSEAGRMNEVITAYAGKKPMLGICCDGSLESAVMIRYVEQEKGGLVFKAGGGITAQSRWKSEYEEVMQKAYVPIY